MRVAIITTDGRDLVGLYREPSPLFGTAPQALLTGFTQLADLEVHVISCTRQEVKSPAKLGENIFFHSLLVPKLGWMRTGFQGCIRAVRKKLHEINPDIVHGQGTERECAISAVFSGFPNVLTIHGNMVEIAAASQARIGSYHWLAARLENYALKRTSGVFCNSRHTEVLVKPRANTTWLVPNPVRPEFFRYKPETRKKPSKCILLNVGTVCAHKRQIELLKLARKLHEQGLEVEFHFIGQADANDTYASQFLRDVAEAENAGFARFSGFCSLEQLIEYYDQSHALVHVATVESFGLVVAEALSRNLKLFASRVGGVPDIADGVKDAELFSPEDWNGLGKSITDWAQNGFPLSENASAMMFQKYNPLSIAQRHCEIYQEVLSKPS